jgi:hypothetical protein
MPPTATPGIPSPPATRRDAASGAVAERIPGPRPPGRARGLAAAARRSEVPPLLLFGTLAGLLFLPALRSPAERIVGWRGDAQQTMWFLRWTPWAVAHGVDPLLTTHINYPAGVNLMWNSLAPALGLALWPVTVTGGVVLAYNLLLLAEIALSAWLAYLAIRRLVRDRRAAVCGGLVYGFSPYLLAHAHGHAKVTFGLLPPLLLILLHEILVMQRRRAWVAGALLGAALALQLLVYEEGVVLAVVAGVAGVGALAVMHRPEVARRRAHAARALAVAAAVAGLLSALPLGVQLLGPGHVTATVPGADVYVTDVANLALPTDFQLLAPPAVARRADLLSGNQTETGAYLGIPLLLIVGMAALRLRSRPPVRWALVTGGRLLLLSMGPQLHIGGHVSRLPLPWRAVEALPLVGSALPARLFVGVDLLAGLLLAAVLEDALRAPWRRPATVAALALTALTGVTLLPALPFPSTSVPVPPFFRQGGNASLPTGSVALVAPFAHDGPSDDPMLWQAVAGMGFRMPEGYFVRRGGGRWRSDGPAPSATSAAMIGIQDGGAPPAVTAGLRRRLMADLARWRVQSVIVGPMAHQAEMRGFVTQLLERAPQSVGGVLLWRLSPP